jgi:hypothetical protein
MVRWHCCGEPMTFVAAKQEFILLYSISHHQHHVALGGLHVGSLSTTPD